MRVNACVSVFLGIFCVLAVMALCNVQPALGAALWLGTTNDFNASSNWADDDYPDVPGKNPSGQNCYLYKSGAGHLSDMNVTADIGVGSLGVLWAGSTSPVTVGSAGGYTITISNAEKGINSATAGLGLLTINSNLRIGSGADASDWAVSSDVTINGDVSSAGSRDVRKIGDATLTINGDFAPAHRYMEVYAGTVTFGSGSSWTMHAYDGDRWSSPIFGSGTLNFNGTLKADVADAASMTTGSWNVINNDTLTESYGSTFAMAMATGAPFTNSSGVWSYVEGGTRLWQFSQSTGTLTLTTVPEPGSIILSVTGLIGLLVYGWRRRK